MSLRHPKLEAKNWVGKDGRLRYDGRDIDLQLITGEELKILGIRVSEDRNLLREMLNRTDLKEIFENAEELEQWKRNTLYMISVRKKQTAAIDIEFIRRKKFLRPMHEFVYQAIREKLGDEVLAEIAARAEELLNQHTDSYSPEDRSAKARQIRKRAMCGEKICHKDKDSAHSQIEEMRLKGNNTRGMGVYPCPYCGWIHVGHKTKHILWERPTRTE